MGGTGSMLEFLPSVYEALGSISVLPEWVGKKCKFVYYINLRSVTVYSYHLEG